MRRSIAAALAAVSLAGCASFSADGGFGQVSELTRQRTGQTPRLQRSPAQADSARARSAELLQQPLTADAAVELAYLNNAALRAKLDDLGLAEADLVQAGRLRNPSFSLGRLSGGGQLEIDRALTFDLLGALALPIARQVAQGRFELAQLQAAHDAVGVAADARRAYFDAVAAQQLLTYSEQVKDAADASSELAKRMRAAGHFNPLAQLREQSFQADASADLARAQHQAVAQRERLVRVLGLGDDPLAFRLPERLPDLPAAPFDASDAEQTAVDQRLDVLMARRATASTAEALGLTRATRFVNVLDAGYQNRSESGSPRSSGAVIQLELPLFDFGSARVARAEATYRQALNRAAATAANARSEVRAAHSAYRSAYALAQHHRDEVVPLRQRISDENLLRYNGMLTSVFDLLADAREQVRAVSASVEALRAFWTADTELRTAITGRSPGSSDAP